MIAHDASVVLARSKVMLPMRRARTEGSHECPALRSVRLAFMPRAVDEGSERRPTQSWRGGP